jgi:hypothetical protein
MRTWTTLSLAALLALAAGCRQPDGPTPAPTPDRQNEIRDLAKDMINVINSDPEAPGDLADDISRYAPNPEASEASRELARRLADALPSARLDDPTAQRLAHSIWVGLTATELSARQVDVVKTDVRGILQGAGVAEPQAESVAQQLGVVQEEITNNPKRWYQVF